MQITPTFNIIRNVYIPKPRKKTVEEVIDSIYTAITHEFGIGRYTLQSKNRIRQVQNAKKVACYLLYNYTPLTLKGVAIELGGMDHSSIIHAIQKFNDLVIWEKTYAEQARRCELAVASVQNKFDKSKK